MSPDRPRLLDLFCGAGGAARGYQRAGECEIWTGAKMSSGYGIRWYIDRPQLAHRVAWMIAKGPIPEGQQVHHLCGNKLCLNVEHMQIVSPSAHPAADAARRDRCPRGHEYAEDNTKIVRGWRMCLTCRRERNRRVAARRKRERQA